MLRSMTGFGVGSDAVGSIRIEAEARAVNHRGLHVKLRVPAELAALEPDLEALVRARCARGSIGLGLTLREGAASAESGLLDEGLLAAYVHAARAAATRCGLEEPRELAPFLALPGVAGARALAPERAEELALAAKRAVEVALAMLDAARAREGRALLADLEQRADAIEAGVARIRQRAPRVVAEWRERLARRMSELFSGAGGAPREEDLLREAALFAERSDIEEELTRLAAHLQHLRELLAAREPVGRKLDFLLQEMNREANTIGSKASDLEIARDVVELRAEVDRLKEQVQNVE
ncbi:MAG: YicC family protein [Planctomycetes bacterium]|nr:YicC family protein [Planctomycetota bacterium]